ncbi:MAG: immunoglobulin domain-containing protein [Verrucomicrobia bacterium]|nr:immunoglobulin domain-containing protein [Verrucomicrobiota bacterium]
MKTLEKLFLVSLFITTFLRAAEETVPPTPVAPAITTQPANVTVNAGQPASFTVSATGTPSPSYQWRKNDNSILGAINATYSIAAAQANDAGRYDVIVSNSAGAFISAAATLTVNVAPAITVQPASVTVNPGQGATFIIVATGTPAPSYQWRKDGNSISGATAANYSIPVVQSGDAGRYDVIISNIAGALISAAATLTVNLAPTITAQPTSVIVNPGQTATFTVSATATPAPSYQWRKDGAAIAGATNATYSIAAVQPGDAGNYTVVVSTSLGAVTSNAAALFVNFAPAMATQPASVTAAAGQAASLSVAAIGSPPLSYQWRKNGAPIAVTPTPTLTFSSLQPGNAGIYRCVVINSVGSVTSEPAILGVASTAKVIGSGAEVGSNVFVAANGNTYDQLLLQGAAATITADPNQITRISYIDLSDDIVQIEFAGAGSLSLTLDNPTGPAAPLNYNQTVGYMKGHAGIVIAGANETTNVLIYSVGRITAVNQALFRSDVTYDGVADLAYVAIASANGKFGGVRMGNASYFGTNGFTGLYAPGVQFNGPIFIHDISAFDAATSALVVGSAGDVRITGGDLQQANGRAVQVDGLTRLQMSAGTNSHGTAQTVQPIRGRLERNGVDVTTQLVP